MADGAEVRLSPKDRDLALLAGFVDPSVVLSLSDRKRGAQRLRIRVAAVDLALGLRDGAG